MDLIDRLFAQEDDRKAGAVFRMWTTMLDLIERLFSRNTVFPLCVDRRQRAAEKAAGIACIISNQSRNVGCS